jgi:DNA topoisomerase-1
VHPEIFTSYQQGELLLDIKQKIDAELRDELDSLRPEEAAVLALLETRLSRTLEDQLKDSISKVKKTSRAKSRDAVAA